MSTTDELTDIRISFDSNTTIQLCEDSEECDDCSINTESFEQLYEKAQSNKISIGSMLGILGFVIIHLLCIGLCFIALFGHPLKMNEKEQLSIFYVRHLNK